MDIKEKIEEIVEKVKADKNLFENFMKEPVKTVEKLIGVDLPDDQIKKIAEAVKAKVSVDEIGKKLGGLGKLFGK
ncbi:MAG: hypothetical protein IKI97_04215 [Clostridia bacterium]|nr:hypothetical protein [Clostridia bacterium]